jgi:hypothetical protein
MDKWWNEKSHFCSESPKAKAMNGQIGRADKQVNALMNRLCVISYFPILLYKLATVQNRRIGQCRVVRKKSSTYCYGKG